MYGLPSAVIIINQDVTGNTLNCLKKQLYITEVMDGYTFDGYVEAGFVNQANSRLLVTKDLRDHSNRDKADVVLFVNNGSVYIEQNKFGPPRQSYRVAELYWGKLRIFSTIV